MYFPPNTVLGWFNYFIAQWFFLRLARVVDKETQQHIRWQLTGFVWPLTGWWSEYKWIGKRWRLERI